MTKAITALTFSLVVFSASAAAADEAKAACPMHAQHMAAAKANAGRADGSAEHGRHVDSRHDTFGMSHTTSTHSFRLFADGGAIELRAIDAADEATVAAIRAHLQKIVAEFEKGDFSAPRFVHGSTPDGIAEIRQLRSDIAWRYQRLAAGGRIRITTRSAEALAAVHAFLRFQVIEHRTANKGEIEEDK